METIKLTAATINEFGRVVKLLSQNEAVVLSKPFWDVLGGNTSPNLLPVPTSIVEGPEGTPVEVLDLERMEGTPFDPNSRFLAWDGKVLPNPFYLKLYKIVELFKIKDGVVSSLGLFFDLDPYASILNSLVLGHSDLSKVKSMGMLSLSSLWGKAVQSNHHGFVARAVAHVRCDLPKNHVAIDRITAGLIGEQVGLSSEEVNGVVLYDTRFPTVDGDSCQEVVLRVCKTTIRHIGTHPALLLLQGGDNDGDTLNLHQLQTDLKKIDGLGLVDYPKLPRKLKPFKNEIEDIPLRTFSNELTTAIGLGSNQLQGIVTNFFERLSLACFLSLYLPIPEGTTKEQVDHIKNNKKMLLKLTKLKLKDLKGDKKFISQRCQQTVKGNGLAAVTEIVMDRRKHVEGAPERYDDILSNIIGLALGKQTEVNAGACLRLREAGGKDGRNINAELINTILKLIGGKLNAFLAKYPATTCMVGNMGEMKLLRLSEQVSQHGVDAVMSFISGNSIEPAVPVQAPQFPNGFYERVIRGVGERPGYLSSNESWRRYMQAGIHYANDTRVLISVLPPSNDRMRVVFYFTYAGQKHAYYANISDPQFCYVPGDEWNISGFEFKTGNTVKYSRSIIRCKQINAGQMAKTPKQLGYGLQSSDIESVTVIDIVADEIVGLAEDIQRLINDYETTKKDLAELMGADFVPKFPISPIEFKSRFQKRMKAVLDEFGRLPGKPDDGIEIYPDVNLMPHEMSVQIPQGDNPWSNLQLFERMMYLINGTSFPDPVTGLPHKFSVGVSSKSRPGFVVTKLPDKLKRTVIEYVSNPWSYNGERERRECRTNRFGKILNDPQHLITTRLDRSLPDMLDRSTDLVIAFTNGDGLLRVGESNPDAAYLTLDGYAHTKTQERERKLGPLTLEQVNQLAPELTGVPDANLYNLLAEGWKYSVSYTDFGQYDSTPVLTRSYTLTSPEALPESMWKKIAFQGHKTVALPLKQRAYVNINGEPRYVDVLIDINTIKAKKMEANLLFGLYALLSPRKWQGDETVDQVLVALPKKLAENNLTGMTLDLHNEKDKVIGQCNVGLFRCTVLKEDEQISTSFKPEGMSWNPTFARLMGQDITLSKSNAEAVQMLSDLQLI